MTKLRVDEVQNPGSVFTLASLKQGNGFVEKYKYSAKRTLDEQFDKWCCKNSKGLSIGETNKKLKCLLL